MTNRCSIGCAFAPRSTADGNSTGVPDEKSGDKLPSEASEGMFSIGTGWLCELW